MEPNNSILSGYLPEKDFCDQLKITPRTARGWRQQMLGPPWIKVRREIYYSKPGTAAWLKDLEVSPARRRSRKSGA